MNVIFKTLDQGAVANCERRGSCTILIIARQGESGKVGPWTYRSAPPEHNDLPECMPAVLAQGDPAFKFLDDEPDDNFLTED